MPLPAVLIPLVLLCGGNDGLRGGEGGAPVSFHRQIRPVLQQHCQGCHQPAKAGGKLDLTSFGALAAGGKHGPGVAPGKPGESLLYLYLTGEEKPRMPKGEDPLAPELLELFRLWIAAGAADDTPASAGPARKPGEPVIYRRFPPIAALAFSPDGSILAVSGYRETLLRSGDGEKLLARLEGVSERLESLAFSPDGRLLAAVGGSPARFGEAQVWDVEKRALERSWIIGSDCLYGVSFSADGSGIAFGASDNSARLYSIADGKLILKADHHSDWCFGAQLSIDGKHLVSVSRDRAMKLTQVDKGQFLENIASLPPGTLGTGLQCLARHPKEDKFLTGGEDGVPRLFHMLRPDPKNTGDDAHLVRAFDRLPGAINAVAFNADGTRIAAATSAGEGCIYDAASGKAIARLEKLPEAVFALTFHPSGGLLAAGCRDGRVRFFDAGSGKVAKTLVPFPLPGPKPARSF